jgi:hypothetical protein
MLRCKNKASRPPMYEQAADSQDQRITQQQQSSSDLKYHQEPINMSLSTLSFRLPGR